jgi:hypothetical protein
MPGELERILQGLLRVRGNPYFQLIQLLATSFELLTRQTDTVETNSPALAFWDSGRWDEVTWCAGNEPLPPTGTWDNARWDKVTWA